MAEDNLTLVMIIVAVTLAVVALMLAVNTRKTDRKLRSMASHIHLLHHSESARELCQRIRNINPELCAGIDFTLKELDGKVVIDEWNVDIDKPE